MNQIRITVLVTSDTSGLAESIKRHVKSLRPILVEKNSDKICSFLAEPRDRYKDIMLCIQNIERCISCPYISITVERCS